MKRKNKDLAFGKKNYRIMLIGVATIIIGYIVMLSDKEEFGFGFLGLTLGPIIVMVGFIIEFFAILHNPDKENKND